MIRSLIKVVFLAQAALEVGRERLEDCLDALTLKAGEIKSSGSEQLNEGSQKVKELVQDVSEQVWRRSEILENQIKEKIRRQVADFSLGALGDTTEINELRAEIATLRAEINELKAIKVAV